MIFRQNSFLANLYRWFYRIDYMPDTLCPYFWALLWALIASPFKLVYNIPFMVAFESPKVYFGKYSKYNREDENIQSLVGWIIFAMGLCVLSTTSIIGNGFPHEDGAWFPFVLSGLVVLVAGIIFLIGRGIWLLYKGVGRHLNEERYAGHTPAVDVVTGFIHAKYNRYCPKITWK